MSNRTWIAVGCAFLILGCAPREKRIEKARILFEQFIAELKSGSSVSKANFLSKSNNGVDVVDWFQVFQEENPSYHMQMTLEVNGVVKVKKKTSNFVPPTSAVDIPKDHVMLIYRSLNDGKSEFSIMLEPEGETWKIASQTCWGVVLSGKWHTLDRNPNGSLAKRCNDFQKKVKDRKKQIN